MTELEVHDLLVYLMTEDRIPITPDLRKIWFDQLRTVTAVEAMEAARLLMSRPRRTEPKVWMLQEALRELSAPSAIVAWRMFEHVAARYHDRKVDGLKILADVSPAVGFVAATFWDDLKSAQVGDKPIVRAQFMKAFDSVRTRAHDRVTGIITRSRPAALPVASVQGSLASTVQNVLQSVQEAAGAIQTPTAVETVAALVPPRSEPPRRP